MFWSTNIAPDCRGVSMYQDRIPVRRRLTGLSGTRLARRAGGAVAALVAAVLAVPSAAVADGPVAAATQPFKGLGGVSCADMSTLKSAWYYNWWLSPGDCAAPGFVPMVSGKGNKG